MPTGKYKRTPEMMEKAKRSLALGRLPENRVKAATSIRKTASSPEWRARVSKATTIAMHDPAIRERHLTGLAKAFDKTGCHFKGGNGREPVAIVRLFTPMLEESGFTAELPVLTRGHGTGLRCPNAYKVDFGNQQTKTAIEFDGPSHRPLKKKALDFKKDTVLKAIGWKVIRIQHD